MGPFNSREIATALWLLVFAVWGLRKPGIRKSLGAAFRTFCHYKILSSVVLMLLYVVGVIAGLRAVGMWDIRLLKDTITWLFVGSMAMMVRFVTADDTTNIFRKILADNIKIVVVLELLINTYTFPLAVELILVPVLTFVAVIDTVASMNKEHALVAKLTKVIQSAAGFVILAIVLRRAVADLQTLRSADTFRSVALAPVLSICMFPFIYVMVLISQYEMLFIRLHFGIEKTPRLRRYLKRRVILRAGFSLARLHHLQQRHLVDLMHVENERDVDRILEQESEEE